MIVNVVGRLSVNRVQDEEVFDDSVIYEGNMRGNNIILYCCCSVGKEAVLSK